MSWQGILGHDAIVEQFRLRLQSGRLASTFLFVGLPGVGKRLFAHKLAQALLCQRHPEEELNPCGACPSCQQVAAGTHPDVLVVEKPAEKARVQIDQLIGPKERRLQEGLIHDIGLKPYSGRRRIGIIDDADTLSAGQGESANALLKTLEEPPPQSVLILIGTSEQRQLPTIRSRAQVVRFSPLSHDVVAQLLLDKGLADDAEIAQRLAELSGGSLQTAVDLADADVQDFRRTWLRFLADRDPDSVPFAKAFASFVDEAGSEAPKRRSRMKLLAHAAIDFYRQLLRTQSGLATEGDADLRAAVEASQRGAVPGQETIADALERCHDAIQQIDANANLTTLTEAWIDDLAQLRVA